MERTMKTMGDAPMIFKTADSAGGVMPGQERFGGSANGLLSLAAAPTFAIMALLTSALDAGQPDLLCSAAGHSSPLSGMAMMYLLMTAFHSAPWLKLLAGRRKSSRAA
jgi:hypothetical protein